MQLKRRIALCIIFLSICLTSNYTIVNSSEKKSFKKLVILPLENLGKKGKDIDSIGKEISISLKQSLSQVKELSVVDPNEVRTYYIQQLAFAQFSGVGDEDSIKNQIDKFEKLDVDLVLSGTYRVAGNEIKVMIQLVDVTSGEVKITPIVMKEKYPDSLFYIEENIAEKTAYSINTMFESYYRDFASFYKFTTNREAYRLYLMGIDAESDQTIQGYAKAMKCFYEAYQTDNSFILPLEEMKTLKDLIFDNIKKAAYISVSFSDNTKIFDSFIYFTSEKGMLAKVILSANEIKNRLYNTSPAEFKRIYENYSISPYSRRGEDAKSDIESFPNEIGTLFNAWDKIDNFNPDSGYR